MSQDTTKAKRQHKAPGETQVIARCSKLLENLTSAKEKARVTEFLASKFAE